MGKYLDMVRKFEAERRRVTEKEAVHLVGAPAQLQEDSWPCPGCGGAAAIEAIEPSSDGQCMLTFWRCEPCQRAAVTPDTIREPPVWVSRKTQ